MHELGLALDIVDAVSARAAGARVQRVVLEVGTLAAVLPDALRFCFAEAAHGTPLAGATLEIVEVPGLALCRHCGAEVQLDRPYGRCACGHDELDWLSGEQLTIRAFEVL